MENLEWKLQGKSPLNKVLNVETQKEDLISLQSINGVTGLFWGLGKKFH
jgi:hypothetical protein